MNNEIFKFEIPSGKELKSYQDGILGILNKVELNECDELLIQHLKSVYQLLKLLTPKS